MASVLPSSSAFLEKRKAWLDYSMIFWNAGAAVTAVIAGAALDSISLTVFGLEGLIQTFIGVSYLFTLHFKTNRRESDDEQRSVDRRLLFVLGLLFFLLALYILNESGSRLFYKEKPQTGSIILVLSVLTIIVITVLAFLKLLAAKALKNKTLLADARENALRGNLSLLLLIGFWLQTGPRWWWADSLTALFMLPYILRQGWKIIEESKSSSVRSETAKMSL